MMNVTLEIPEDISSKLQLLWRDLPHRTLELVAWEAFRTNVLDASEVSRLLCYSSAKEFDDFVRRHTGVADTQGRKRPAATSTGEFWRQTSVEEIVQRHNARPLTRQSLLRPIPDLTSEEGEALIGEIERMRELGRKAAAERRDSL